MSRQTPIFLPLPLAPRAENPSNLTPAGIGHDAEVDLLREAVRPGGTPVDTLMPVRGTKQIGDDELRGRDASLRTVPPREYGNR